MQTKHIISRLDLTVTSIASYAAFQANRNWNSFNDIITVGNFRWGNTPLDEAHKCGNRSLIKLLEDAKSKEQQQHTPQSQGILFHDTNFVFRFNHPSNCLKP